MKRAVTILGLLWLVCSGLTFNGCGGSGSSGFDASLQGEQAAIDQVTEQGGCVEVDGTTVCAPAADVSGDVAAAPPETEGPVTLTVNPDSDSSVDCIQQPQEGGCAFTVSILPANFPIGTTFIGAVRLMDPTSPWTPADSPFAPSSDPSILDAIMQVEGLSVDETAQLQIAVLVYLPDTRLPPSGATEQLLSSFLSDVVFVVTDITAQGVSSP